MTGLPLARSAPAAQRVSSRAIAAFLDRLTAESIECHSVMIMRHGHVIAEGWWQPYSAERPHLLYSLTKSFTAIAVGFAVADGLLALDDRVVDVLPDHVPGGVTSRAAELTVRHLLTMTTGHRVDSLEQAWILEPADLVRGFLRVPILDPPGSRQHYDNSNAFVLARMVESVTGRDLPTLLDERLFGPLGIKEAEWDRVAGGAAFGFHGLHLTTESIATFGELLLRGGRELIPRDWVEQATTHQVGTEQLPDGSRHPDELHGYGYQFWMSRHGYRGQGAFGQYCLVLPEQDMVIALTTGGETTLLEAVWDCLLPGVDVTDSAENDADLAARLRHLSLPIPAGDLAAGRSTHAIIDATTDGSALPPGTSVTVDPVTGGWQVRIDTPQSTLTVEVGHAAWRESSPLGRPVVAAGAWQGETFVADLYVITTPHRVHLVVEPTAAVATWNVVPLTGPNLLLHLRSPLMTRPDVS